MTERREPTISDPDKLSDQIPNDEGAERFQPGSANGSGGSIGRAKRASRPAPVSQRVVEVKSPLAPLALVAAIIALGFSGLTFWQMSVLDSDRKNSLQQLSLAEGRIAQLEQKLAVTGNESEQSLATLSASFRALSDDLAGLNAGAEENSSEIKKLWGVAYDRNRKAIEDNSKALEVAKQAIENLQSAQQKDQNTLQKAMADLQGELAVVSEVQESQQSALSQTQNIGADIQALKTEINSRLSANEEAIRSMDAFRLQVNRRLLELGGTAN